jgi:1,4-alpha-glucan branching enzyme
VSGDCSSTNFGATLIDPTTTRFRFWAPALQSVAHEVERLEPVPMRRLDDGWFEAETLCGAGAAYRFHIAADLAVIDPAAHALRGRVFGDGAVTDPGCVCYRRTCDRPGCDSRPQETRKGKTLTIAVNLSEQAAAWSAHDALVDRLYRESDFLFESVEGV